MKCNARCLQGRLTTFAVAAICLLAISAADAANIVVNSFLDNGVGCTLRKAVANANAGGAANAECTAGAPGGNAIMLATGTYAVNLPVINLLNRAITIQGNGPGNTVIDGQNLTRLFNNFDEGGGPATTAVTITIQGLTITRGRADSVTGDIDSGAGMYIEDNATVNFTNVAFVNNVAVAYGAALDSRGTVNINNCTFNTNTGSSAGEGGAIRNIGTLTITNSAFFGNSSGTGGAIYHSSSLASRSLTVSNSTFFSNTGLQRGGAIAANNSASVGPITLTHVTIAGNSSPAGMGGGIFKNQSASFTLDRSIIAGNTAATGPDCNTSSSFNSLNHNVFGTLASCTIGGTTANNFVGAPLLNMPANNGGTTPTISLQPYSPARDRVPTCATSTDQRGQSRPLGTACDSGAFEAFPTVSQPPTIGTATAGNGQATVNFTAPTNNGGSAVTNYLVTPNPPGPTATGSTSPVVVTGLSNGVAYTFTVRAFNALGPSTDSAASNSVTPVGPPGPPTGVVATPLNGAASVTFTPPVSNGGSPITLYTAISNPGGFSASGSGTTLTVTGLTNGSTYFFTVRANNASGSSVASAPSNSVTPPGYVLTVSRTGSGSIASVSGPAITCGGDCTELLPAGVMMTLAATADAGFTFTGWSGGGCTGTGNCTVTMSANQSVTATFTLNTYNVTASAGANGSIAPSGVVSVNHGATTVFSVTPDVNYLTAVTGTCGGTLIGTTYTTSVITAPCTVVANFTPNSIRYRLGEDDALAISGGAGNAVTNASNGGTPNLDRIGAPVYASGVNGHGLAMQFDGASGYRAATTPALLAVTDNFVLELWAKNAVSGSGQGAMLFYTGNTATSGFGLFRGPDDNYAALFGGVDVVGAVPVGGDWMHLALVRNNGASTLYVNGLAAATSGSVPAMPDPAAGFSIGVNTNTTAEFFNGMIDDVRFRQFAPGSFSANQLNVHRLTVNLPGAGSGNISGTDVACVTTCTVPVIPGATLTLTAIANGGSGFAGWSGGGCTGTSTCTVTVSAATTVSANFVMLIDQTITFGAAPVITVNATDTVTATGGGSGNPVLFTSTTPATCTVSGAMVTGVATGTCTIAANQAGNAGYSAAPQVTQSFSIAPPPIAFTGNVYSRKTHGNGVGVKDLPLFDAPITGTFTVEPRIVGGGHQIVFRFTHPVTSVTGVGVTDVSSANIGSATPSFSGNDLVINVSGIADGTRVTVSATGVNGALSVARGVGFMVGDVNGSRAVNAADISAVKSRASPTVNDDNYLFDLNLSGVIDSADVSAAKARTGFVLP